MTILDSMLGSLSGNRKQSSDVNPLLQSLSGLLEQNGGIEGLMDKFSQGGLGEVFSSWVGPGQNQRVSAEQIQTILGTEQVAGLAKQLGVDPKAAATLLSQFLPKLIDKLTPTGQVQASAGAQQSFAALMPSLLQGFAGGGSTGRRA